MCREEKKERGAAVEDRETRRINGERSGTEAKVEAGMPGLKEEEEESRARKKERVAVARDKEGRDCG